MFDNDRQLESLWAIEEWANDTTDGSLADLPAVPEPGVWDRVCAEHGNCLGKKCQFYQNCFWQSAKRRMQSGNILVVNHALFFSDLALRMAGVNYLPKYDAVILDEAHTVEDVAGSHFGIKVSGIEVLQRLRRSARWTQLPILVVTGVNDPMLRVRLDLPIAFKPDIELIVETVCRLLPAAMVEQAVRSEA